MRVAEASSDRDFLGELTEDQAALGGGVLSAGMFPLRSDGESSSR
jgi:hypothetical protein